MELRIIKTDKQYRRYLNEAAKLAVRDPDLKSVEGGRLELLAKLIEDYEKERFEFGRPDPIEAIAFRMEQQGCGRRILLNCLAARTAHRKCWLRNAH